MICDVHAHCIPTLVAEALEERGLTRQTIGRGTPPVTETDADLKARLALMDEAGVQVQVLSISPLPFIDDEAGAVQVVREGNDAMAEMVARYPTRFQAYAELPLPYLDASLRELERCRRDLGFQAVNILTSSATTSAIDEQFSPLYEELDRTGTIVFFHPRVDGLCTPLINDYGLTQALGPVIEDTVLVAQMVGRQFPHRFPNLKIIVPHLGGVLPIYLNRMDNQVRARFPDLPERPSQTVRRLWYDTVSHGSAVGLRSAWEAFGVDRIVTGSDFPALQPFDGYVASIDYVRHCGLPEGDVEQILHVNAPRLFGLESG
jgi:aminocarboxymuconate-semialdehyde decarboxylase